MHKILGLCTSRALNCYSLRAITKHELLSIGEKFNLIIRKLKRFDDVHF